MEDLLFPVGAFGYIIKPFAEKELLIHVINGLERRKMRLQSRENERLLDTKVAERTAELRRREEMIDLRPEIGGPAPAGFQAPLLDMAAA